MKLSNRRLLSLMLITVGLNLVVSVGTGNEWLGMAATLFCWFLVLLFEDPE